MARPKKTAPHYSDTVYFASAEFLHDKGVLSLRLARVEGDAADFLRRAIALHLIAPLKVLIL